MNRVTYEPDRRIQIGVTRRAARFGFAALILGAGAAAVGAHPLGWSSNPQVEVLAGDPRLDLAWALEQGGMGPADAMRMSVLLIDQVDPKGELEDFTQSWSAEIWWRTGEASSLELSMIRARVGIPFGSALKKAADASGCAAPHIPFFAFITGPDSGLPVPPGTTVLVRVIDVWETKGSPPFDGSGFIPIAAGEPVPECETVVDDLEQGVSAPTYWPMQ